MTSELHVQIWGQNHFTTAVVKYKTKMPAVFGYPGGKSRAVKVLDKELMAHFPDATTLWSPFFGGGSFELHCAQEHGMKIMGNDIEEPLIHFWKWFKKDRKSLAEVIADIGDLSHARYFEFLDLMRAPQQFRKLSSIVQAAIFYLMTQSSFSCTIGNYSESRSRGQSTRAGPKFEKAISRSTMKNVHFTRGDMVKFLRKHPIAGNNMENPIFLDPPYVLKTDRLLYGVDGKNHRGFDHKALREELGKRKYWILCYNDHPEVRKLYRGYKIKKVKWAYSLQNHREGDVQKSNEIIIVNTGSLD